MLAFGVMLLKSRRFKRNVIHKYTYSFKICDGDGDEEKLGLLLQFAKHVLHFWIGMHGAQCTPQKIRYLSVTASVSCVDLTDKQRTLLATFTTFDIRMPCRDFCTKTG